MTVTEQLALPAEILLWLGVVAAVVAGLALILFAIWFVPVFIRTQREAEQRHADFRREFEETRESIRRGARRAPKRFTLHDRGDAA